MTTIFDLDGTLADVSIRRQQISIDIENGLSKNKALSKFHSAESIDDDLPNWPIVNLFKSLQKAGRKMIIVSGRKDAQRDATLAKLAEWGIGNNVLYMREHGDVRPDLEFKKDLLNRLTANGEEIELVVDDQTAIINMWRKAGICALNCSDFVRDDK